VPKDAVKISVEREIDEVGHTRRYEATRPPTFSIGPALLPRYHGLVGSSLELAKPDTTNGNGIRAVSKR